MRAFLALSLLLPLSSSFRLLAHSPSLATQCARHPELQQCAQDTTDDEMDDAAEQERAAELARAAELSRLRMAADQWLGMCSAITLSGEAGLQPFSAPSGWLADMSPPPAQAYTQDELITEAELHEPAMSALLDACADRAPVLCSIPAVVPLARLAAWTSGRWVRPLDEWEGDTSDDEESALRSLTAHLLEKWDVPPALHGALVYRDGPPISEAAHRVAKAFLEVHVGAGAGDGSVLSLLRSAVAPCVSKAAAKEFVKVTPKKGESPLHTFRRAQVTALGGEPWVGDAACGSALGRAIQRGGVRGGKENGGGSESDGEGGDEGGAPDDGEAFGLIALEWVCRHQHELCEPFVVTATLNYLLEMRSLVPKYTCVGRTPKTVGAALEAYTASSVSFDDGDPDEAFQPNPRGLRGWFEMGATIPAETCVRVPYDGRLAPTSQPNPSSIPSPSPSPSPSQPIPAPILSASASTSSSASPPAAIRSRISIPTPTPSRVPSPQARTCSGGPVNPASVRPRYGLPRYSRCAD